MYVRAQVDLRRGGGERGVADAAGAGRGAALLPPRAARLRATRTRAARPPAVSTLYSCLSYSFSIISLHYM